MLELTRTTYGEMPLMRAKLRAPDPRPDSIERPQLMDRLDRAVRTPLTLVRAPAGAGKTETVATWVARGRAPGPVVWLTLDPGDADPDRFWAYLATGLRRAGRSVPDRDTRHPERSGETFLMHLAATLYEEDEPVVVVLDEAEVLARSGAVPTGLAFLLRHARPQIRLVVLSRVAPALPVERYRLSGLVDELGWEDLSFSCEEAVSVLAAQGATMTSGDVTTLQAKTQGWPAGLRLATLAIARTAPRVLAPGEPAADVVSGDRGELADYMRAEILDRHPDDVRSFLLRTSIVEHLTADLAEQLTGRADAAHVLDRLQRGNALVRVCDRHPDCHQYHPLFADLLRGELGREAPGDVPRLHEAIASWARSRDLAQLAVHHLVLAGRPSAAATAAVQDLALDLLLGCADIPLGESLAALAPGDDDVPVAALLALDAAGRRDSTTCARYVAGLEGLLADTEEPTTSYRLALSVTRSALERLTGAPPQSTHDLARWFAETQARGRGSEPTPEGLRSALAYEHGLALLLDGHPGEAARVLRAIVPGRPDRQQVHLLGEVALARALAGETAAAVDAAVTSEALAEALQLPQTARSRNAAAALAWLASEEADSGPARLQCDRAEMRDRDGDGVAAEALVRLVRMRLARAHEGSTAATALLTEPPVGSGSRPAWLELRLRADWAGYEIAHGRIDAALAFLGDVDPGLESARSRLVLARAAVTRRHLSRARELIGHVLDAPGLTADLAMEAWLLLAACELLGGSARSARDALARGLALGAPSRLRRPVFDAHSSIRALLRSERDLASAHPWLQGPFASRADEPVRMPAPRPRGLTRVGRQSTLAQPLTARELEVLGHLSALLTTEQVAQTMFLSVNTVKTHISAILRKLAVTSRNEAVRRARDLDLV